MQRTICPSCSSKNTIKKGTRKNKQQTIQKYRCKQCKKHFALQQPQSKHKTYPISIILKAISTHNLGNMEMRHCKLKTKQHLNT